MAGTKYSVQPNVSMPYKTEVFLNNKKFISISVATLIRGIK